MKEYRLNIRYGDGENEQQIFSSYEEAMEEAERIETVEDAETDIDQIEVE